MTYSPNRPLPEETISALGDRGYRAEPHFFAFGDAQVIWRNGDKLVAGSDGRNRGRSILINQ